MSETRPGWPNNWWEQIVEKITDVPWGILAFLVIMVLTFSHVLSGEDLANAKALLPVAGLLGIGQGIHQGSKHLRR
jgi:hypothetical protein